MIKLYFFFLVFLYRLRQFDAFMRNNENILYLHSKSTKVCCICEKPRQNKRDKHKPVPSHIKYGCLYKWHVIIPNTAVICKYCWREKSISSILNENANEDPKSKSLQFLHFMWLKPIIIKEKGKIPDDKICIKKYNLNTDHFDVKLVKELICKYNSMEKKYLIAKRKSKFESAEWKEYMFLKKKFESNKNSQQDSKMKKQFKQEGIEWIKDYCNKQKAILMQALENTLTNKYTNHIKWSELTDLDCYAFCGLTKQAIFEHTAICNQGMIPDPKEEKKKKNKKKKKKDNNNNNDEEEEKKKHDDVVLPQELFWLRCRMYNYFTYRCMSVIFGVSESKIRESVTRVLPIYNREYAKRFLINVRYKYPYWTRDSIKFHTPQFANMLRDIQKGEDKIILCQDGTYQYCETNQSDLWVRKFTTNAHKKNSLLKMHIIATASGRPLHCLPCFSDGYHSDGKIFECTFDQRYLNACYNQYKTRFGGRGSDLSSIPENEPLQSHHDNCNDNDNEDDDMIMNEDDDENIDSIVREQHKKRSNFWSFNPRRKKFKNGFDIEKKALENMSNSIKNLYKAICPKCYKDNSKKDATKLKKCINCNVLYCNEDCRSSHLSLHSIQCNWAKTDAKINKQLEEDDTLFASLLGNPTANEDNKYEFNAYLFETLLELKEICRLIYLRDHLVSDNGYLSHDPRLKRPSSPPDNDKLTQTVQDCNWKRGITAIRQVQERLNRHCKRNKMLRSKVNHLEIWRMGWYWNIALADINYFGITLMKDGKESKNLVDKILDLKSVDQNPIGAFQAEKKYTKCRNKGRRKSTNKKKKQS